MSTFCVVLLKCVHVLCCPVTICPRFVLSCYNMSTFCVVLLKCVHVCVVLLKSAFFSIFRVYGSCRNYNLVSCMHFFVSCSFIVLCLVVFCCCCFAVVFLFLLASNSASLTSHHVFYATYSPGCAWFACSK